jgi:hypothetical protein
VYGYLVGAADTLGGTLAVFGAVAIGTGWLLPWLRSRTVRPELWGYGAVSFSAGLALAMSFRAFDASAALLDAAFFTSVALIIMGATLQRRSLRPRPDRI